MKRNLYIYNKVVTRLVMGLLPFYLFAFSPLDADAKKHKQLVILHTNDTHSTIFPVKQNIDDKEIAGRGGYLRRVNMLKEQRQQHPDLPAASRPVALRLRRLLAGLRILHALQG